ncbi:hypothetical protein DFH29DRAFT_1008599 [Suillus ampliporus]|nr:hypothetical protein DFH29DRAFT_1008599 [Suillus ampliporus]
MLYKGRIIRSLSITLDFVVVEVEPLFHEDSQSSLAIQLTIPVSLLILPPSIRLLRWYKIHTHKLFRLYRPTWRENNRALEELKQRIERGEESLACSTIGGGSVEIDRGREVFDQATQNIPAHLKLPKRFHSLLRIDFFSYPSLPLPFLSYHTDVF